MLRSDFTNRLVKSSQGELFGYPGHEGHHLLVWTNILDEDAALAILGETDGSAPVIGPGCRSHCHRADRGESIGVFIDRIGKPVIIVSVGMLVRWRAQRVIGVVHAGAEVGVRLVLVLMVKTEGVADLLAHHHAAPLGFIVCGKGVIAVVQLHDSLRNVAASEPYLRQAKPAPVAVFITANLNPAAGRITFPEVADFALHHSRINNIYRLRENTCC